MKRQNEKQENGLPTNQIKSVVSKAISSFAASPGNMAKANVSAIDGATKKVLKKEKLKNFGKEALNVVSAVLPEVAGLIPGAGPVLKMALSTLNDDEWFSAYKSAGATFNEMLGDIKADSDGRYRLITPAFVEYDCQVLGDNWKDELLPTLLAHVRAKTNNVLVGDPDDYWDAFQSASELYAIYYNMLKYIKLCEDLPLNITNLPGVIKLIDPKNFAILRGMADALGNYLKTTVAIPYAWSAYLRWRFGTTFLSENTGKPGLIFYNMTAASTVYGNDCMLGGIGTDTVNRDPLEALATAIDNKKATLAATSRAAADFRVAYADHQIKYDVEPRHYDEKEFNLRCNLGSESVAGTGGDIEIDTETRTLLYLDSRLDQNAAIQAVTMSTKDEQGRAPIKVTGWPYIAWYVPEKHMVPIIVSGTYAAGEVPAGWRLKPMSTDMVSDQVTISCREGSSTYDQLDLRYTPGWLNNNLVNSLEQEQSIDLTVSLLYDLYCVRLCYSALQLHNQDTAHYINWVGNDREVYPGSSASVAMIVKSKLLSYDAALIATSQVQAIHRVAMRNLIRGDYKAKTPTATKQEVVEPVKEMVADVVEQVNKEL